jgi:hypothetical protein
MMTKSEVAEMARAGVIDITFTKKDGTFREMRCTLHESYLPPLMGDTETKTKDNPDVLAVWDIEVKGWRSFRLDSLMVIEPATK